MRLFVPFLYRLLYLARSCLIVSIDTNFCLQLLFLFSDVGVRVSGSVNNFLPGSVILNNGFRSGSDSIIFIEEISENS